MQVFTVQNDEYLCIECNIGIHSKKEYKKHTSKLLEEVLNEI